MDSGDLYRKTTKIVNSKSEDKTGVVFHTFDVIPLDEFKNGKSKARYEVRRQFLESIIFEQKIILLVTAINPTPAGEGKTTTTVGLGQALSRLNKKAIITLREPSLGPCFGIKGGSAGGGYAQVVPMEDLNLHFTGDFHAITYANNLLEAMLDNHLHQGNVLSIDPNQIVWKRCVDMNDRVLRNIVVGLGRKVDGVVREDHFIITVASEIMAILCLAENMEDLKERLGRIIVAYSYEGKPITAKDLNAVGSMAALLKDAIKPNLIQTLENTPAIIHGGPFANIAHGCNSVRATKTALKLAAEKELEKLESLGFGNLPVCMAKNQYSLSDDPTKLGRPTDFNINIREVYVSAGAGFVVAITGSIMTMPGLPNVPAAENINVNEDGIITELF